MATTATASPETPIGYGRMKRKEDARFIRGQGKYLDDIVLPGHAPRRRPAQPLRAREDRLDRRLARRSSTRRCSG